jgi:hypothetical protein
VSQEGLFKSAHSCRVCSYRCEGDFGRRCDGMALPEMVRA